MKKHYIQFWKLGKMEREIECFAADTVETVLRAGVEVAEWCKAGGTINAGESSSKPSIIVSRR